MSEFHYRSETLQSYFRYRKVALSETLLLAFFTGNETSPTYNKLQLESSTCPTHGYFCISLYCISYIVYVIELINVFTYLKVGKSDVKYEEQQPNICTASIAFQLLVINSLLPTHQQ
jgi:hypothetical protein